MKRALRLSAVVPATNEPATLDDCLSAISSARESPEEVIVMSSPSAGGPAAARNRGAAEACGDVLVFVDADVVVHPDAFARVRAAFTADPQLAALFGSYDDDPRAPNAVSSFRNLLHHHVHQASPGPATTFWSGLGAIRRDLFSECGGFDSERFSLPSIEDVELGMRLADRDARIVLDPELLGTHLKAWSISTMVRTDVLQRGVPWVGLLLSRRSAPCNLNLGWRHRASAASVVVALLSALLRRRSPALAAGGTLVALNRSLYTLLWQRRGARHALASVPLHALHLACAVVALPLGMAVHMAGSRRRP